METETRSGVRKSSVYAVKQSFFISLLIVLIAGFFVPSEAKSVYAITNHEAGTVTAYPIQGNQLGIPFAQADILGSLIDVTVDSQQKLLFLSYEGATIACVDADTLAQKGTLTTPQEMAGIVADELRQRVYAVGRQKDQLYIFRWDGNAIVLLDQVTLTDLGGDGAFGISLDKVSRRLYVANNTAMVHYYDADDPDWAHLGSRNVGSKAMDIDVDSYRGYLYAGGYQEGGGGGNYLIKHNLRTEVDPNHVQEVGTRVVGVAVDPDSGLVYVTTWDYQVRIYDCSGYPFIQTYSVTNGTGPAGIAVGPTHKVKRMHIVKRDNKTNCVSPQELITYTIAYHPDRQNETNVVITDKLPEGLEFVSASPNTGTYYERPEHKYVWLPLENVPGYDPNTPGDPNYYFTLTVQVNTNAEPNSVITNIVEAESDEAIATATETTPVCCWDSGGIIYVDRKAMGANIGTSWKNAYRNLQVALARAGRGCGSEIWVAKGIYKPGIQTTDTFTIPAGISIYGGFEGWETSKSQRDIKANPTILSGDTGIFDFQVLRSNTTIVTMWGNNSSLDGFTVRESGVYGQGIYGKDVDFAISNCSIENNQQYGLYAENGNVSVNCSIFKGNGFGGIYHKGYNSKTITVETSQIQENGQNGIYTEFSIPMIRNNQIGFNGTGSSTSNTYYGLYLYYPKAGYSVRNNTVVYNVNEGIRVVNSSAMDIRNCIVYGNKQTGDENQMSGNFTAHYSCIWDPNHPNQTMPDSTYHNISCDPKFTYDGNSNVVIYHLLPPSTGFLGSPCIDRGDNSDIGVNEKDIDGEDRWMGTTVDMGADEVNPDCTRIYNPLDWNADGLVNLVEFNYFSKAWMTYDPNNPLCDPNNPYYVHDPNAPGYISPQDKERFDRTCDLNHDLVVDAGDLALFIPNWIWTACWRTDIHNPRDWDYDGFVNYHEFCYFAKAWLSHPSDAAWDSRCDLNRDNQIDLADLILFIEDTPWLWVSDDQRGILKAAQVVPVQQQPAPQPQTEPNLPSPPQEPNIVEEPSIEQQIADLQDSIAFLENLWETDPNIQQEISAEDWQAFMGELYANLADLESQLPSGDPNDLFFGMQMMSQSGFGARGMLSEPQSDAQQEISDLQDSIQFLESLSTDPQFQQEMQTDDWQRFMNEVYNSLTELQENDIIIQEQ